MFHFEVIGPVPSPSRLQWSKVESEKSLAGGLCKGKKENPPPPYCESIHTLETISACSNVNIAPMQFGSAWPGLKYAVRRGGSGDPPFPSTHRIIDKFPRLCTSQTKAPTFFPPPNWRPVIRVRKCSPRRSDNWSTFIFVDWSQCGLQKSPRQCYIFFKQWRQWAAPEETERREMPSSRSSWAAVEPLCPR